jgi:cation diffusion facilitator family transporter
MLGSAVINQAVSHLLFKVGRETDSIALQADAWHLRTDVYTSLGVFAALGLMAVGEWLVPGLHLHWIDPVAAIGVAILIIHAAFKLTERATSELLDSSLPPEEEAIIHGLLKAKTGRVCGYHQLRTRKSGAARFIEFHLLCDGRMTNAESHALAHEVSSEITAKLPQATVTVHVEPCAPECSQRCLRGCLLTESERKDSRARKPADGYAGHSTS